MLATDLHFLERFWQAVRFSAAAAVCRSVASYTAMLPKCFASMDFLTWFCLKSVLSASTGRPVMSTESDLPRL